MSGRTRLLATLVALIGLLAISALPASAKEGAIAKLDTAIHRDAEPGSTIDVGWSVFMVTATGEKPVYGSPIYIRLVSPNGTSTEMSGTEKPVGSGHYTASIVVPKGGISQVIVAMVGEQCDDLGNCTRADIKFPLTDDALVSGTPVGAAAPAPAGAGAATAATPAPNPIGPGITPLIIVGVASALAAGLGALIVARRRQVGVGTAGGASGD